MKKLLPIVGILYKNHFLRYLFVGGTTFIIDFGTLFIAHEVLHLHLVVSTSLAYVISITYNFTLNRWWTFSASENQSVHKHLAAYLTLLFCNYLFTVGFVWIMSHFIHYAVAKSLAVILQISWTFPIYKYVIFAKKERTDTT